MSVSIIEKWTCDFCDNHIITVHKYYTSYSEHMITPPTNGWTDELNVPKEYRSHPTCDICTACPKCKESPDWTKYRED